MESVFVELYLQCVHSYRPSYVASCKDISVAKVTHVRINMYNLGTIDQT